MNWNHTVRKTPEYHIAVLALRSKKRWVAHDFICEYGFYRVFRNWKLKRL